MKFAMKYSSILLVLLIVNDAPFAWAREQPVSVEELLQGDDAIEVTGTDSKNSPVVTLGRRFGGSVVSLYYRGVEYVNNNDAYGEVDYGRQLQSAVQYRGAGECFNPTEAGGKYDRGRPGSTSRLLSVEKIQGGGLRTETDMAFWMAPGQKQTRTREECTALNDKYTSGYILKRTILVGFAKYNNVVAYTTQFIAPIIEASPRYVPVVIHTPSRFTRIFTVNADGVMEEVVDKRNERGALPYMQATGNLKSAVLVCSAKPFGNYFYGYTRFPNTTTSRFVSFASGAEKESRVFENFVIVGSTEEVRVATAKVCF